MSDGAGETDLRLTSYDLNRESNGGVLSPGKPAQPVCVCVLYTEEPLINLKPASPLTLLHSRLGGFEDSWVEVQQKQEADEALALWTRVGREKSLLEEEHS